MKIPGLLLVALTTTLIAPVTAQQAPTPAVVVAQTLQTGHDYLAENNYRGAFNIYSGTLVIIPYGSLQFYWERKQMEQYRLSAQNVEKIVQGLATCLDNLEPAPAIPDTAAFHAKKGATFVKLAKDQRDYEAAIKEFQSALRDALWVSDYHYNLAICQKSADQLEPAFLSLRFALILARDDNQRRDINALRAELEAMQEIKTRN